MSKKERDGFRPPEYSSWHRVASIERYVPRGVAETMLMCDVDVAYWVDGFANGLVGISETKKDIGRYDFRPPKYWLEIGKYLPFDIFLGVLWYTVSDRENPADPRFKDIDGFKWKMFHPVEKPLETFTPYQWANHLLDMCKYFERKKARFLGDLPKNR